LSGTTAGPRIWRRRWHGHWWSFSAHRVPQFGDRGPALYRLVQGHGPHRRGRLQACLPKQACLRRQARPPAPAGLRRARQRSSCRISTTATLVRATGATASRARSACSPSPLSRYALRSRLSWLNHRHPGTPKAGSTPRPSGRNQTQSKVAQVPFFEPAALPRLGNYKPRLEKPQSSKAGRMLRYSPPAELLLRREYERRRKIHLAYSRLPLLRGDRMSWATVCFLNFSGTRVHKLAIARSGYWPSALWQFEWWA
jgi:hypothetical protein